MRVAAVQVSYDDESGRSREAHIDAVATHVVDRLSDEEIDLVVLPELWSTGAFRPRTWTERAERLDGPTVTAPTVTAMAEVARVTGAVVHLGSIIERAADDALFNTAVVLGRGGAPITTYRKIHRFAAGGREAELLSPGDRVCVVDLPLRNGSTVRAGLSTCYDLRFPELFRAQSADGAEMLLVPASWPKARSGVWDLLLRARAVENQAVVVGVNATGQDGRTPMGGGSLVLDARGEPIAAAGADAQILVADVDLTTVAGVRDDFPVLADRRLTVAAGTTTDA